MTPRVQTTLAFLISGMMLAFATTFIMIDELRPFLEGQAASSPEWQARLAGIYPFPSVTEVRMLYAALNLIPMMAPLFFARRWAAWVTMGCGTLLGVSNLSDGVFDLMLGGRPLLGVAFVLAVGAPALAGVVCAWRWSREGLG